MREILRTRGDSDKYLIFVIIFMWTNFLTLHDLCKIYLLHYSDASNAIIVNSAIRGAFCISPEEIQWRVLANYYGGDIGHLSEHGRSMYYSLWLSIAQLMKGYHKLIF